MTAIWSFLVAFVRVWYRFIVGDDWTLAAAVAVALVLTWALLHRGIAAWWLVPLVAIAAVSVSILRAPLTTTARKQPDPTTTSTSPLSAQAGS
jgi:hypothetical protein